MNDKEPVSEKEINSMEFRVCCLNPVLDGGSIRLESSLYMLCGCGHGMNLKEINKNIIWKGKPYIKIPYCKYCYSEDTIGVFDDTPQLLGWSMELPSDENPYFKLRKLPKCIDLK